MLGTIPLGPVHLHCYLHKVQHVKLRAEGCLQAEITTNPSWDPSRGIWIDSIGGQRLDDLLDSFILPQEL